MHGRLKVAQLVLAIITACLLVFVFFPSVTMLLSLPFGIGYVVWAARASANNRWSMALALLMSAVVAVLFTAVLVISSLRGLQDTAATNPATAYLAVDQHGNLVDLRDLPGGDEIDVTNSSPTILGMISYFGVLILFTGLAWGVVVFHIVRWRSLGSTAQAP